MEENSIIDIIKNELPKMGLVDRFFYLINKLILDYNDEHYLDNIPWRNELSDFEKEFHNGYEEPDYEKLYHQDFMEFLFYDIDRNTFLQHYGNKDLQVFILQEIRLIVSIFNQKFALQLSYLTSKVYLKKYYLSDDSDFLLIAPFFYNSESLKSAYIHELAISDVDERVFLIEKYIASIREIEYRINSHVIWDAGKENERMNSEKDLFPRRNSINLYWFTEFLNEISGSPLNSNFDSILGNEKDNIKEKLVLIGLHPESLVNLICFVLKKNEKQSVRNFIANSFKFNTNKYKFQYEITKDILVLKSNEDTIIICKTILLLIGLNFIQNQSASFLQRILIAALKKRGYNKRVWLSDDLRKYISEWMELGINDLVNDIGFSSKDEFTKYIKD
ncbi:hypothetical protein [Maribacter sp. R86514]|uniref:hypothetical protein n=1 Tax=Maribacter sp. R86514 TaxID=3093854 RepID=UPI0037C8226F